MTQSLSPMAGLVAESLTNYTAEEFHHQGRVLERQLRVHEEMLSWQDLSKEYAKECFAFQC